MRNVHNALADTLRRFVQPVNWRILPDPDLATRWRIQVWDSPESMLDVEILDLDGTPVGCVLERKTFPFRTMQRFMNTLMRNLEDGQGSPPGGEPPYA